MKSIRTNPTDGAPQGDEREEPAYGPRILTLDQQRSLIAVRDAAQAVWDYAYEREGELDALVPLPELSALGRALKLGGGS